MTNKNRSFSTLESVSDHYIDSNLAEKKSQILNEINALDFESLKPHQKALQSNKLTYHCSYSLLYFI